MTDTQLWTALITPMNEDGSIHYNDLDDVIVRQEEAGNGILVLGSTGEGLALSDDEKKEVVDFVSERSNSVPIMVGVGGFNLKTQIDWISYCNKKNIESFLLVNPLYSKPGLKGQIHWFKSLMDASGKPCMIYNIPSRTGVKLYPEVLQELDEHDNLWAVKEASGSIAEFQEFRKAVPTVPLFSGDDGLMPFFAAAGGSGLVSVASNIWPMETKLYVEKCLKGETTSLFPIWTDAVKALFSASNPIPLKVLMKEKGLIKTSVLRSPLTDEELSSTEHLRASDEAISNWYQLNK
jgi:4-hydroxy-tetrahydrodipicolinate synthase